MTNPDGRNIGSGPPGFFYTHAIHISPFMTPRRTTARLPLFPATLSALVAACLIFYFLMSLFTPPQPDDLHYAHAYRHWLLGEGAFPGFDPWWQMIKAHFNGINGRLGDKLLIGYLLLPKWLAAAITSVASTGFMLLAAYISTGNLRRHAMLSAAVIMALILCLPWYDTMFTGCMTVNYTLGIFIGLAALAIYWWPCATEGPRHNRLKLTGALLLGFIAGSWHECFTFIMAPGLLAYPLFVRRRLNRLQWAVLAGGVLGGIFIICNPGFWTRYDNQMHLMTSASDAIWILYYANISLLLPVLLPISMAVRRLRRRYTNEEIGIMTACAVALCLNVVIFVSNLSFPRVMWYGMTTGIIGLATLAKPFTPGKGLAAVCKVAVCVTASFTIAHMACAAVWQYKLNREYRTIIGLYRQSADGTVFFTQKAAESVPLIAMSRPYHTQFQSWRLDAGKDTFYKQAHMYLQLVPEELRGFRPESAKLINPKQGIYIFRGYAVADGLLTPCRRWQRIHTTCADGTQRHGLSLCHRFRTPDGHTWYYIQTDAADAAGITIS